MADDAQPSQPAADPALATPLAGGQAVGDSDDGDSDGVASHGVESHGVDSHGVDESDFNSGDSDATVLTATTALEAEEFPQGLSPRELALTLTGQLLGHFHLQEFIGGGGMGAVFKALDTTLDRIVAVKVVASQSVSGEELQRRFLIEAQSTARLDHPNIARIHFVGRDRGLPYIVFEYIDGVNLRDLVLNHGPIPLGDALSFTSQIAHALAHAWQKEVVHRDIKPSNILVTREGQAKLVDMGLARLHQVDAAENDLTSTGVTLGTFDYISPEQARDPREADTRSDIYSLGCTLFYMLAGRPPFADGTAVQKLLQHQDQSPPNLSELRPDIPKTVAQLVRHMLAKSPEQRPQTPAELVATCNDILLELGLQPPQSLLPLPMIPRALSSSAWRIHLPWAIPLAALLAIGGGSSAIRWDRKQVEFQPLRRPIATEVQTENSESVVSTTPNNAAEITVEGSKPEASAPILGEGGSINAAPIWDFSPHSEWWADESSLLEFSANESAPPESNPIESEESLDLEGLILSE